jgi:ketosteroid isomerase-like protein
MADEIQRFRDMLAAWNRQDWKAVGAFYATDAVLQHPDGWPEPGPSVGRDAIVAQWQTTWQAFGEAEVSIERAGAEDDTVVAQLSFRARGGESGAGLTTRMLATCRMRDGECVEHRVDWEPEEA